MNASSKGAKTQSGKAEFSGLAALRDHLSTSAGPRVSTLWLRWFAAYAERYVRKHFHSVRLLNPPPPLSAHPLVIYLNHASWWDPMICFLLRNEFFARRHSFAPMDAEALARYPFFRKLGFFAVEQNSRRGAAEFVRASTAILARDHVLWLTPQGRFSDVREQPVVFRPGLAHVAARVARATYLPLAIEYSFWEERLPEVCVSFGEPLMLTGAEAAELGARAITQRLELRLMAAQADLATAVVARDTSRLRVLSRSHSGVGGIYDLWRRARAILRNQSFIAEHGTK